jgi:hypothetical protein
VPDSPTSGLEGKFIFWAGAVIVTATTIFCIFGLVLVLSMKIVDLDSCRSAKTDGYEALSVTLPELEDVSAFLSSPDVPLILQEDLKTGHSIGKGATGVVRSGTWYTL